MTCSRQNFEIGSLWNDHIPVTTDAFRATQTEAPKLYVKLS